MTKKILTGAIALVMVFSLFAVATPTRAADDMSASASVLTQFNRNLTIGSTGSDVAALQTILVNQGFLVMPVGVAKGYFGNLTRAALAKFQASVQISPAVGYFGPITRGYMNTHNMSGGSTGCQYDPATGQPIKKYDVNTGAQICPPTTSGGGTSDGTISTPGKEGIIVVTSNSSGVKTTVYEGDKMVPVLGFNVEAKNSDVLVQRVKVDLGTSTNVYVKDFSRIYILDANKNVLASMDLNSSNVARESSTLYTATLTGFNSLVRMNEKRQFFVAVDVNPSISSEYRGTIAVKLDADAVRARDGAGQDQTGPGGTITQNVTISRSLTDAATLTISTDPNLLKSQTIVANQGANNDELDQALVGSFTLFAEKADVLVRDLTVTASSTTTGATEPTAYLFDSMSGSAIATASGSTSGTSTTYAFTSIDRTIPNDGANHTYWVKVDVRGASATAESFQITRVAVDTAEAAATGATVSVTAQTSGVGNAMTIVSKGVQVGTPSTSIDLLYVTTTGGTTTEAHLTAQFTIDLKALGADAVFGTPTSTFSFSLLKNGTAVSVGTATVSEFYPAVQPNGTTNYTGGTTGSFTITRNSTATVTVTYKVDANSTAAVSADLPRGATFAVRLNSITYTSGGSTITNDYTNNPNFVTASTQGHQ